MQELREFEKGIVSRAEEILVCGENPLSLRRRSSNARLVSNRSDLLKSSPVAGITRGFGRGFPSRKPSTGKLMSTPSIPEEQEERSKSLNYSESTEIFGPSESFESSGEHPPPTSSFSCSSSSSQSVSFVLMMLCFLSCSRRIFVTPPALLMTTTPSPHSPLNHQDLLITTITTTMHQRSFVRRVVVTWMGSSRRCKRLHELPCCEQTAKMWNSFK
jgi:hypothetical protein